MLQRRPLRPERSIRYARERDWDRVHGTIHFGVARGNYVVAGTHPVEEMRLNSQQYEEEYAPRGLWSRVRERVFGAEEVYDGDGEHSPEPRRRASLRLDTSRYLRVDVRRNAVV